MTVYELERRMPVSEMFQWFDYYREPEEPQADDILSAFGLK
jgi:hypothetical protein